MRRSHTLAMCALVVCALVVSLAVPESADARSRLSRGIIGIATAPIRAVVRAVPRPRVRHSRHSRRAVTARAYAPAAARVAATERAAAEETTEANRPQTAARASAPVSFNAYEDLIGYALWPDDYAARFWARGYGDIMKAMVSGTAATAAVKEDRRSRRGRARTKASETDTTNSVATTGMCAAQTEDEAVKPVDRVGEMIELSEAQKASLAPLRAAVREAVARGKVACRDALPPTPAGRLKTATDGLWAMRDADILLRTPLVNFYAALTDDQKEQLSRSAAANGDSKEMNGNGNIGNGNDDDSKTKPANAEPCSLVANDLPVEAIERLVQPNAEQRGTLEMVKGMSAEMSGYLAASCPREAPTDAVARLDAAGNRLNAMLYAVMLFDQALNGFYLQLDDEQKKRFDGVRR